MIRGADGGQPMGYLFILFVDRPKWGYNPQTSEYYKKKCNSHVSQKLEPQMQSFFMIYFSMARKEQWVEARSTDHSTAGRGANRVQPLQLASLSVCPKQLSNPCCSLVMSSWRLPGKCGWKQHKTRFSNMSPSLAGFPQHFPMVENLIFAVKTAGNARILHGRKRWCVGDDLASKDPERKIL